MTYFKDESTDLGTGVVLYNEPGSENIYVRVTGGPRRFLCTRGEMQDFLDRAYGPRELPPRVVIRSA